MYNFKKSLIALVGILFLAGGIAALLPLVGRGQGKPPFAPRTFYLTQTTHNGSQALSACADGYHMASLWEIFDTSNLRYNTALGTTGDGSGPPTSFTVFNNTVNVGWIRTGSPTASGEPPGISNCHLWTSDAETHTGTLVGLTSNWESSNVSHTISPWRGLTDSCETQQLVWCVQD
jgi:hypothetical protein